MRRHYIDNLRWAVVLLLFPFHTCMMFNNWGENFYVRFEPLWVPSFFNRMVWPWFMTSLFTLAGMSAAFSLEKRTVGSFIRERFGKLLLPLVSGILLVVPVQTYFAERFHNGYSGGYFAQYALFFGKIGDLTGYSGGFTPGQLWFILILFVISLATLPLVVFAKKKEASGRPFAADAALRSLPFPALLAAGFLAIFCKPLLSIGGKSIVEYACYYLLGFFVLSSQKNLDTVNARFKTLAILAFTSTAAYAAGLFVEPGTGGKSLEVFGWFVYQCYAWSVILFLIAASKRFADVSTPATAYLTRSSFAVYVFHQSVLVTVAFYSPRAGSGTILGSAPFRITCMLAVSVPCTFALYELVRRIPPLKKIFAIG